MQEAYERSERDRVGLLCGTDNTGDTFKKIDGDNVLVIILSTELDETPVQDWFVGTNDGRYKT